MTRQELLKRVNTSIDEVGLEKLLMELSFSASFWARYYGFDPTKGIEGMSMMDIACQSLELVLTQRWSWDPERSNLKTYLKNNVIKGIFRNIKVKGRIELTSEDIDELNALAPDEFINESLDVDKIIGELESYFDGDELAFNILLGKIEGLKRRDIIKEFSMSDSEYDNAMKRYKTKISQFQNLESLNELKHV